MTINWNAFVISERGFMKIFPRPCRSLVAFCFVISAFAQQTDFGQSLAEQARKLRKDTTNEVKMTEADTKKLFESVDLIFAFASEDTGMPKHAQVKRRLVGKADVEKYVSGRLAKEEFTQRFQQEELSMKKLGFLPRDFNLAAFLVRSTGQEVAGYYDEETKTISLLNWVPADRQEPILAHELTHALQDQNYDLAKWMKPREKETQSGATDDSALARKAVVEGQAMVVYVDFMLGPYGRSLEDTPGIIYRMEDPAVKAVVDSQLMHDAPMILREAGTFAYKQGLIFEGELLHRGGKQMAFAGVFARPPQDSHEVLHPEAYIERQKVAPVHIPDMRAALNNQYAVYDSGVIGELDVRALLKQYGERKIADDVSTAWQGGAYVTFRKTSAGALTPNLGDLALFYISRWKTSEVAERFARFYADAVSQRYQSVAVLPVQACSGKSCPVSRVQVTTEEGPVIVDHWDVNTVIVSEGFDTETATRLRGALRAAKSDEHAESTPEEIGLRLFEIPAFQRYAEKIGEAVREELTLEVRH
jgi:hypothetical protein